jgi:hypothetical protein
MRLPGAGEHRLLSPPQLRQFRAALLVAFELVPAFDAMLLVQLGRNRQHITLSNNAPQIVLDVIRRADSEAWTTELLQAARAENPTNPELQAFAETFGLAPGVGTQLELERTIRTANSMLDPVRFRTRLAAIEGQVCRIEIDGADRVAYGTGFLIAADAVMTNYHVIEQVRANTVSPSKVTLRFDYKRANDLVVVNEGTKYGLATGDDWLVDYSEYSPLDEAVEPGDAVPTLDQLDYAVLRVNGTPGDEPIGGAANPSVDAPARKWIELPSTTYPFTPHSSLFMVQHPAAEPLQVALDNDAIIAAKPNGTRVRYSTNSAKGSSGSPCFDANWNLIALHHAGDPNFEKLHQPTFNQGVPISTIVTRLKARGTLDKLGLAVGQ